MDQISVIIPVYNCAAQVGRCIDSLLAQNYENIQIVAVDDGSSDGSLSVLTSCARRSPRVCVIHKENGGVTSARLAGLAAADGEWIGFVDADDGVDADMYSRLMANALEEGADISHCGHRVCYPDGGVEFIHNTGKKYTQDHDRGLRELLDGGQIDTSLCTKLYRRSLFPGLEDWMDPQIKNGEDLLMNYYLFDRAASAVYEDFCPYQYILREGSASNNQFHEHALFDPVLVRQKILENSREDMRDDARRALLRNLLFAYALASQRPKRESGDYRARARAMLREQKDFFPLLSARNRVLAAMICTAPWAFDWSYGAYKRLFQRQEKH